MKHFSTATWIDFVRGVLPSQKAAGMKRHLEGCDECRESYRMWSALVESGRKEKEYQPSDSAVQRAKAAFGLQEAGMPSKRKPTARLVFDSFLQPAAEGVRSSMVPTRQLQYRSGPLLVEIDLRKESHGPGSQTFLMGQILNVDNPNQRVNNLRVLLFRGKRFTAVAKSNTEGEFGFELADGKDWKLLFEVEGQEVIPISLPELTSRPPKATR